MATEGLRHILVPVDFSELSALGLCYAEALANCSGAQLSVVFANPFQPPPYFTQDKVGELQKQYESTKHDAEVSLREFIRKTLPKIPDIPATVVDAMPVDAILKEAERSQPDMIVMGTHGRGGINRLLLGSVTERVIRQSRIPVLAVRGDVRSPVRSMPISRILCPVNDTPLARRALYYAARIGDCFGAIVTVLHVKESSRTREIADLSSWIPPAIRESAKVEEMVREGEAAHEAVNAASEIGADVLVLGAHHQTFFDSTVIGATTVRILRHAPCPVLTVFTASGR
jgi:nucleotide-binding universal stress UspA family protein